MLSDNVSVWVRYSMSAMSSEFNHNYDVDFFLDIHTRMAIRNHREYVEAMIRFNAFASEAQIG
jgi:hypothetical protein